MRKLIPLLTAFTICFSLSLSVVPTYAVTVNNTDGNMTLVGVFNIEDARTQEVLFTSSNGKEMIITLEDLPIPTPFDNWTDYVGIGTFKKKITIDEGTFKIVGVFTGYRNNPYIVRFDDVILNESYLTSSIMTYIKDNKYINNQTDKAEARYIVTYSWMGGTHRMSLIAQLEATTGRLFAYTAGEW